MSLVQALLADCVEDGRTSRAGPYLKDIRLAAGDACSFCEMLLNGEILFEIEPVPIRLFDPISEVESSEEWYLSLPLQVTESGERFEPLALFEFKPIKRVLGKSNNICQL